MAFFGNLFRRKEPTASSGDTWKDTPWPDGPSFLGAALLLQFIPEDRQVLTDLELANLTAPFAPGMRKLVELWIVVYVTWLMRILVDCKIDDDFSDDMMAAAYGRIATNEDRLPGIESRNWTTACGTRSRIRGRWAAENWPRSIGSRSAF
jgi:hypothetical protein